ncbi:hypothetical protein [Burkholderia sp. BCC0419]|uniref:hypothetical protein n=1 Tax=Burkholderia sp. BCC0419 TaxID=486878 RepID=UPI00158EA5A8|nr:hypothetical protein [Burkholderia sp. BCC0419]
MGRPILLGGIFDTRQVWKFSLKRKILRRTIPVLARYAGRKACWSAVARVRHIGWAAARRGGFQQGENRLRPAACRVDQGFPEGKNGGLAVRPSASASVSTNDRKELDRRISTFVADIRRPSEAGGYYRPETDDAP